MDQLPELAALSHLARLEPPATEAEAKQLRHQLTEVVAFFKAVQAVDTSGVEPYFQPFSGEACTPIRADVPDQSLDRAAVFANAPEAGGECFFVPRVL